MNSKQNSNLSGSDHDDWTLVSPPRTSSSSSNSSSLVNLVEDAYNDKLDKAHVSAEGPINSNNVSRARHYIS